MKSKVFIRYLAVFVMALVSGPQSRAGIHTFDVVVQESAEKRKEYLATSAEPRIWSRLRARAAERAAGAAKSICESVDGRAEEFACLRRVESQTVHKWGGRIGYKAYEAIASVSVRCHADERRLNLVEEWWYGFRFPVLEPCPSHRVFRLQ